MRFLIPSRVAGIAATIAVTCSGVSIFFSSLGSLTFLSPESLIETEARDASLEAA